MNKKAALLRESFFQSINGILPVDLLFDDAPDIVFFVKDAQCRYMAVSETLVNRCGLLNKEAALGLTAEELFPPPFGSSFALQDREILRVGRPITNHLELHLYPSGKSGWCLTCKQPIIGKSGQIAGIFGFSRDLHSPGVQGEDLAGLSAVIDYIHRHYDEALRLPGLAKMAGLSIYQLNQRVRAIFHVTAGQYLLKVRIDAARRLLAHSDEAIVQIGLTCGYSDQSAFTRQFRQVVGITPNVYRMNYKV